MGHRKFGLLSNLALLTTTSQILRCDTTLQLANLCTGPSVDDQSGGFSLSLDMPSASSPPFSQRTRGGMNSNPLFHSKIA